MQNQSNPNAGATRGEEANQAQEGIWPCPHCTQTFRSSHAMRGHQNCHRQEKEQQMRTFWAQQVSSRPPVLSIPPPLYPSIPPISGPGFQHGLPPPYPYWPSHGPAPDTGYGSRPWFKPEFNERIGPWLTLGPRGQDRHGPDTNLGLMVGDGSRGGPGPNMAHLGQMERMVGPTPLGGNEEPSEANLAWPAGSGTAGEAGSVEMDLDLKL